MGYHRGGCVFVIELGTASLSEAEQEAVTRLTDGLVTFRTSKPLGRQILAGTFAGQGHGNFRTKALLEGSHRLPHYFAAALPAQTGGNARVDGPEQLYGLERYAEKVLKAFERVPEDVRNRLWYGGALTVEEYRQFIAGAYDEIYSRTDHSIEGWEENGWTVGTADGLVRRMSPREVWAGHGADLVRVPHWAVTDFLGAECYREARVGQNGLFEFQDRDLIGTARKLRFTAVAVRPDGTGERLMPGRVYGLYVLPHDTTQAVVVDAKTRGVVGMAAAWSAVEPLNREQVGIMVEAQARMIALQSSGIRERHAAASDSALVRREETDLILSGLGKPGRETGRENAEQKNETRDALKALAGAVPQRKGNTDDEW